MKTVEKVFLPTEIYMRFEQRPRVKGTKCRKHDEWHDSNRNIENFLTAKFLSDKPVDCFR